MSGPKVQGDDPARKIAVAAIAVMSLIAIGSYALLSDPPSAPAKEASEPAQAPAAVAAPSATVITKAEAKVRAEPGVVDMVYDPDSVVTWTIAMKDDGSSRVGRAETFCLQLAEWGVPKDRTIVRIVDARRALIEHQDFRAADLGTVVCATGDAFGR